MDIQRGRHLRRIAQLLEEFPVVSLLGARQVGKTTLARACAARERPERLHRFDLEDPRHLQRLQNPMLALEGLRGLVVIDEVQRLPSLFPILRVLADRPALPARFLLLGSASPELVQHGSETLAGRVAHCRLGGFDPEEVGADAATVEKLWLRGGFPRAFLAPSEPASVRWRQAFVSTFLERDLPAHGLRMPAPTLRRFWSMLAHYHGQIWNGAELARAFGVSEKSVRRYLDILEATFMVRVLRPWHANLKKRQVKAPKVYIADSGLLHTLLELEDLRHLRMHPKVGASWEGFALEWIVALLGVQPERCHHWSLHSGAELDLFTSFQGQRLGFEFKYTDAPRTTPSMRSALRDLALDRLFVVYPGPDAFHLSDTIHALPLGDASTLWQALQEA